MPFNIVAGPNKLQLLTSHTVVCNDGQPITVSFDIEIAGHGCYLSSKNVAVVRGLEWTDPERESWEVKLDMAFSTGWRTVVGTYNTKTREGTLEYL